MSDPNIQRQLDNSYAKLQALQSNLANVTPTNVVPIVAPVVGSALAPIVQEVAPQVTIDSMEILISKLIEERLAGLLASATPTSTIVLH